MAGPLIQISTSSPWLKSRINCLLHGDGTLNTRRAARDVGGGERAIAAGGHPFYEKLNRLLAEHGFD
jgi:hypothetical protein